VILFVTEYIQFHKNYGVELPSYHVTVKYQNFIMRDNCLSSLKIRYNKNVFVCDLRMFEIISLLQINKINILLLYLNVFGILSSLLVVLIYFINTNQIYD